ncbi:hypothetical protein DMN91_000801 [Ooceraea biroi]|uniref:Uncharacterized protein n=1 Tax=Ooceraea biroi TaxID=2015173 RepID=A0A3L8E389_OOCBI|nr:hypothetical protein DMN91_000801 [Ooceraea biroi]
MDGKRSRIGKVGKGEEEDDFIRELIDLRKEHRKDMETLKDIIDEGKKNDRLMEVRLRIVEEKMEGWDKKWKEFQEFKEAYEEERREREKRGGVRMKRGKGV